MNRESFDAIIIGAGHNGLTAAAVLAGKGRRVLVLERSATPGGMAAHGMLAGTQVPRFAHLLYNLNPTVARDIGLKLATRTLPTVALAGDGRHVVIRGDDVRFTDGSDHPDADAFQDLHRRLTRFGGLLGRLALAAPPDLSGPGRLGEMARLARLGLKLRLMGKPEMREFLRILMSNATDLILDTLPDGPLAGALATDAVRGAHAGPASPGTVFSLIYRLSQGGEASLPEAGWPAVAAAFAEAARGATLRCDTPVARILIDADRVRGVALSDGSEIAAPLVLSTAGAVQTMILTGPAQFDIEASRRLRQVRSLGNAAKVNLVLDRAPVFPDLTASQSAGRLLIAPSVAAVERAFNPLKYGEVPAAPPIEAVIPTLSAPDPSGRHVVSAVLGFVPHTPTGGWTAQARDALVETIKSTLDAHAPGLAASVTASELLTPADIEAETAAPGGHWHHGEMALDQLLTLRPAPGMARYAMGPAGLFLAGAAAHPGGDITGAPGRNAALAALRQEGAA